jgi:hypothetical protein
MDAITAGVSTIPHAGRGGNFHWHYDCTTPFLHIPDRRLLDSYATLKQNGTADFFSPTMMTAHLWRYYSATNKRPAALQVSSDFSKTAITTWLPTMIKPTLLWMDAAP